MSPLTQQCRQTEMRRPTFYGHHASSTLCSAILINSLSCIGVALPHTFSPVQVVHKVYHSDTRWTENN